MLDKLSQFIEMLNGIKAHVWSVLLLIFGGGLAAIPKPTAHETGAGILAAALALLKLPE